MYCTRSQYQRACSGMRGRKMTRPKKRRWKRRLWWWTWGRRDAGERGGKGEPHGRAEDQMRWEANIWQSAYTYVVTKADEGPQGMP